jgi:hypothetical protein
MPRRTILTERQRETLFALPTDEPTLHRLSAMAEWKAVTETLI